MTTTTVTFAVPRRRGWHVIWAVLRVTVEAYLRRSPTIEFSLGEVFPK